MMTSQHVLWRTGITFFEGLSASILSLLQAHPYILLKENAGYFETSVPDCQTKQHNVKEIHNINNH